MKNQANKEGIVIDVLRCDLFNLDEGGTAGYFGICLVYFCPWCLTSMIDMVRQLTNNFEEDKE